MGQQRSRTVVGDPACRKHYGSGMKLEATAWLWKLGPTAKTLNKCTLEGEI